MSADSEGRKNRWIHGLKDRPRTVTYEGDEAAALAYELATFDPGVYPCPGCGVSMLEGETECGGLTGCGTTSDVEERKRASGETGERLAEPEKMTALESAAGLRALARGECDGCAVRDIRVERLQRENGSLRRGDG